MSNMIGRPQVAAALAEEQAIVQQMDDDRPSIKDWTREDLLLYQARCDYIESMQTTMRVLTRLIHKEYGS